MISEETQLEISKYTLLVLSLAYLKDRDSKSWGSVRLDSRVQLTVA